MPTDPKVFSNHGDAQSPSVQVKTRKITKTAVAPFFFFSFLFAQQRDQTHTTCRSFSSQRSDT